MDMIDRLDLGIFLDRDRVEARLLAGDFESRLEPGEILHRRARTHVLVLFQQGNADVVTDRHDGPVEVAVLPGVGGAVLALDRIGIDIFALETRPGRDQVRTDALRRKVDLAGDRGIGMHRAGVGPHRHPGHALDAAADRQVRLAGHDLAGCGIDRLEAGCTEAIELLAWHVFGIVGVQ